MALRTKDKPQSRYKSFEKYHASCSSTTISWELKETTVCWLISRCCILFPYFPVVIKLRSSARNCCLKTFLLSNNAVDRGFEPRSGQTIDYKTGICCFTAKNQRLRTKPGWFGNRIMCSSGATCLHVDYCCSELRLWNLNSVLGLVPRERHHLVEM